MFKTSCLNILIANLKSGGSFNIYEVIKELKDYPNITSKWMNILLNFITF